MQPIKTQGSPPGPQTLNQGWDYANSNNVVSPLHPELPCHLVSSSLLRGSSLGVAHNCTHGKKNILQILRFYSEAERRGKEGPEKS